MKSNIVIEYINVNKFAISLKQGDIIFILIVLIHSSTINRKRIENSTP